MYSRGLVVGKTSKIGIESRPPSPIFYRRGGGEKCKILASFSTPLKFEPLAFENATRYTNRETNFFCKNDRPMFLASLVKLGPRTPENRWAEMPNP